MRLLPDTKRIVATIGYPGHGKSIFLASLFGDSFFTLSKTFQNERRKYFVRALNDEADRVFYRNAMTVEKLALPLANPRTKPEPAILEFNGIPQASRRWRRSIQLTFYDVAGEAFNDGEAIKKYAPFVAEANDLIFLFDPTHADFSPLSAARQVDLIYRTPGRNKRQNFIITLTKMDELRANDEWWANAIIDLWPDIPPSHSDLPRYLRQMDSLSKMWRAWWTHDKEANNLISALPKNTRFCALSSLGHQPVWDCPSCNEINPSMLQFCYKCYNVWDCPHCKTTNPSTKQSCSNSICGKKNNEFWQCFEPNCHTINHSALDKCSKCGVYRKPIKLRLFRKPEPFRVRDPLFWIFRSAGVM